MKDGQPFNPYKQFTGIWIPDWLVNHVGCSVNAKYLYAVLARCAGENGKCFPSQKYLAQKMHLSGKQTRRYITELIKNGLIKVKRHGQGKPNEYIFLWRGDLMAPVVKGQTGSDLDRTNMSDLKRTDPSDLDWTNMSGPYKEELREKYKENKVRESNRARPRGLPEVNAYFLSLGSTKQAAMVFYSQYETTGWTLATGQPIVNWKARAWKWIEEDKQATSQLPNHLSRGAPGHPESSSGLP